MEIRATKSQIEEFKESLLWKDIVRELVEWRKIADMELDMIVANAEDENPSTASVLLHLGDISGRKKAIDRMITLPAVLLDMLEEQKEEKDG